MNDKNSALATRPKTVAMVGLGPSLREYTAESFGKKNLTHFDEVWGINTAYRSLKCDKIWLMDDLKNGIAHNYPDWANELKLEKTPIITSRQYDEFPSSVPYPLDDIVEHFHSDYFDVTPAYMIAYAAYIKVETLFCFGIDFHYPNAQVVETGLGCTSYWLGRAEEHGVHYKVPNTSTLMSANLVMEEKDEQTGKVRARRMLYGYDYNPQDAKRQVERGNTDPALKAVSERSYKPAGQQEVEPK